jgi:hypothetical protein
MSLRVFKLLLFLLATFWFGQAYGQEVFLITDAKGKEQRIQANKTRVRFKLKTEPKKYTFGKIEEIDNRFVYLSNGTTIAVDNISEIRFKPKYKYVPHLVGTYLVIYGNLIVYSIVYSSNCIEYGCGNIGVMALVTLPVFGIALPIALPAIISYPVTIPIEGSLKLRIE